MTGFSLALMRHRLAAARDQSRRPRPAMAPERRPEGPLLWAHIGAGIDPQGTHLVLDEIRRLHPDIHILTTGNGPHPWFTALAPADTPSDADQFLGTWSPDIALFVGNDVFPTLWTTALRNGVACLAAEVTTHRQPHALIEPMRSFDAVVAREADERLGPVCETLGALATVPGPPSANHAAFEDMSETLGTRPVWLALGVDDVEIGDILDAHIRAARMAHRLLLVLDAPAEAAARALDAGQWRWGTRARGEMPASDMQVFLAGAGEAGLWLRIAPVTFLGGTLWGDGPAISPFAAAALGSALVHGPHVGTSDAAIGRLREAGATRRIDSATELGTEIERLMNPDLAAELASAGWTVTSEGAEASARLVELIDETVAGLA